MNNKIFISGKITGDEHYRVKFGKAVKEVSLPIFRVNHTPPKYAMRYGRLIYYVAVNPCEFLLFRRPMDCWPWLVCMILCLWRLTWCSHIYMLRDWEESRGAKIESRWARLLHKHIIYQ